MISPFLIQIRTPSRPGAVSASLSVPCRHLGGFADETMPGGLAAAPVTAERGQTGKACHAPAECSWDNHPPFSALLISARSREADEGGRERSRPRAFPATGRSAGHQGRATGSLPVYLSLRSSLVTGGRSSLYLPALFMRASFCGSSLGRSDRTLAGGGAGQIPFAVRRGAGAVGPAPRENRSGCCGAAARADAAMPRPHDCALL
ncbi:hypothetical protein PMI02_02454 [Novosphingobium sp. AP12]|nr:hypothetical protein PMI02_02454 [Novosphingobium sp. AP12]